MQQYQWAIRITTESTDDLGTVSTVGVFPHPNEAAARTAQEAISDHIADRLARSSNRRVSQVELVRRPIGDWEVVS